MLMLFATVALVHLVALMSPGPDFFFVSQTAASRSRKEAMMGVLGITLGIVIWAGVALMGLHLILEKMAWLHEIMYGGRWHLSAVDGLATALFRPPAPQVARAG